MSLSTTSYELCKGALDGKELFAIDGSKNWRSTLGQPGGARKNAENRRKPRLHRQNRHTVRSCR